MMDQLTFTQITDGARAWLNYIKAMPPTTPVSKSQPSEKRTTPISVDALRADADNWEEGESAYGEIEFYSGKLISPGTFLSTRDNLLVRFGRKGDCAVFVDRINARGVATLEQLATLRMLMLGTE